jgi:hypothetical protein
MTLNSYARPWRLRFYVRGHRSLINYFMIKFWLKYIENFLLLFYICNCYRFSERNKFMAIQVDSSAQNVGGGLRVTVSM